jgi:trimethylamine--corrinoid protein Co-methyltransferase
MPHTRKWYRAEHTFPRTVDRDTYDAWVSLGKKSIADRAGDEVERLLKENPPSLLEKNVLDELRKIMFLDAKNYGICSLPEIRT